MKKTGAKAPEKQAPVVKAKTEAQIKAEKEAYEEAFYKLFVSRFGFNYTGSE